MAKGWNVHGTEGDSVGGAGGMEGGVEGLCGEQVEWRVVLKDSVGSRWNGG